MAINPENKNIISKITKKINSLVETLLDYLDLNTLADCNGAG